MNSMLCLESNQYNPNNIIIQRKMKNNIMDNSFFYRLIYSDKYFSSNGLYILFKFTNIKLESYYNNNHNNNNSKIKCIFENNRNNNNNIEMIKKIESSILRKIYNDYKISISNRLEQQLNTYSIKLFEYNSNNINKNYNNMNIILKISGVWENAHEMGITFKFYTY